MKKSLFLMMNALSLLLPATAFADETQAAEEAARVSGAFNSNWILYAVIAGILIALLVTGMWKAQLKSVRAKWEAGSYVRRDSLNLRSTNERYLFKNVQRVPIPKQQNNGPGGTGGFGGGSHGGTGVNLHFGGSAQGGHSGPGLNYGGHIEPGGRPGARPGAGSFGRPGAPHGRGPQRPR